MGLARSTVSLMRPLRRSVDDPFWILVCAHLVQLFDAKRINMPERIGGITLCRRQRNRQIKSIFSKFDGVNLN